MKKSSAKIIFFSAFNIIVYVACLIIGAKFFFPIILSYINPYLSNFIEYKKISLKILPYPAVEIIDARSTFSKNISIKVNKIDAFLYLPGLIYKKPFNIIAYNGSIKILFLNKKGPKKKLSLSNIAIGFMKLNSFKIEYPFHKRNIILKINNLNSELIDNTLNIDGTFSSNFVKEVYLKGVISKSTNNIDLTFNDLYLKNISYLLPTTDYIPKKISGILTGNINLLIKDKKIKGDVHIKSTEIVWNKKIKDLDIKLKTYFEPKKRNINIDITKFRTVYPYISIIGKIRHINKNTEININAKKINITEVREFYKNLSIKNKLANKIFFIVTSGYLFDSSFKLTKNRKKIKWGLNGSCKEVNIKIPHMNLSLKKLDGNLTIKNNILLCKVKKGYYRHSMLNNGYLSLGLNHNLSPFNIKTRVKFDLRDLNYLLNNLPIPQNIILNLKKIHINQGVCDALFTIDKTDKYLWNIDISNLKANGYLKDAKQTPFNISTKYFTLNKNFLKLKTLNVHFKSTKINAPTFYIDFQKKYLNINFSNSIILCEETKKILGIFIKNLLYNLKIQGTIYVNKGLIKYNYSNNKFITYSFKGHIENVNFYSLDLKKIIKVKHSVQTDIKLSNGDFFLDSECFNLINSQVLLLNSNINLKELTVDGHLLNPKNIQAKLSGYISQSIKEILKEKISTLHYLSLKENLHIQSMEIYISPNKYIYLQLSSNINGVFVKINMKLAKEISGDVVLNYNDTCSKIEFIRVQDSLKLRFHGKISKDVIDRILVKNEYIKGNVEGNCLLHIVYNPLFIKNFKGFLNIYKVKVKHLYNLSVNNISIKSIKNSIKIKKSSIKIFNNELHINGIITLTRNMNYLILNLTSEKLLLDPIINILKKTNSKKSDVNLKGKVNINFTEVLYSDKIFKHVSGTIVINNGFKSLDIKKSYLCGVPIKMYLVNKDKYTKLKLELIKNSLPVETFFQCMQNTREHTITGTSSIQLELKAKVQKGSNFIKTLNGNFNFISKKGRIYRFSVISKILYLINSTEMLFGNIPDLKRKGFVYNIFKARGNIKNGVLFLKDSYINGANMELAFHGKIDLSTKKIDIIVLFAPLKTIDRIVKKIPILRNITGGNLVVIPFQVKGTLDSPFLIPLSPKAVGSEVLGILKNTLKLPYKLIQPLMPGTKK